MYNVHYASTLTVVSYKRRSHRKNSKYFPSRPLAGYNKYIRTRTKFPEGREHACIYDVSTYSRYMRVSFIRERLFFYSFRKFTLYFIVLFFLFYIQKTFRLARSYAKHTRLIFRYSFSLEPVLIETIRLNINRIFYYYHHSTIIRYITL